jgi:hypothetical protein
MLRERLKAAALCIPLIAFTASAVNESLARPHPNDAAVRAFIEHFFTAFDARDFEAIEHSFAPGAKIVQSWSHKSGIEQFSDFQAHLE